LYTSTAVFCKHISIVLNALILRKQYQGHGTQCTMIQV